MNDYFVGQLLYLVPVNKLNIIPLQVVEEITRNTIKESETTFLVQFPDDKKTVVDIKKIKGKIFKDQTILRESMISNATDAIDEMISGANLLQKNMFEIKKENIENAIVESANNSDIQIANDVQVDNNDDIIMVDLGNGVKAKMNTANLKKVANK